VRDDPRAMRARILLRQHDEQLQRHWNKLLAGATQATDEEDTAAGIMVTHAGRVVGIP